MADTSKVTAVLTDNGIRCEDENGVEVTTGGPGPKAGDLLLMAVAGCGGATLKAIMVKEGWNLTHLGILVEGAKSQERPRRYTDITVHYEIECRGLPREKAEAYVKAAGDSCFVMQSISSQKHVSFTLKN